MSDIKEQLKQARDVRSKIREQYYNAYKTILEELQIKGLKEKFETEYNKDEVLLIYARLVNKEKEGQTFINLKSQLEEADKIVDKLEEEEKKTWSPTKLEIERLQIAKSEVMSKIFAEFRKHNLNKQFTKDLFDMKHVPIGQRSQKSKELLFKYAKEVNMEDAAQEHENIRLKIDKLYKKFLEELEKEKARN